MSHLVKIPLRPKSGVYSAHQQVYLACAALVSPDQRVLWRRTGDEAIALVNNPSTELSCKPYRPQPVAGHKVRFSLTANITTNERSAVGRGKRIDPVLRALSNKEGQSRNEVVWTQALAWLESKGAAHGFRVLSLDKAEYESLEFKRKETFVRIGVVDYAGHLEIIDAEKFLDAMNKGIGHGKAWGCGLLLCSRSV